MGKDLSKNDLIFFNPLPFVAGVTTRAMGNYKSTSAGFSNRMKKLRDYLGVDYHSLLVPNHGTIINFSSHKDENSKQSGDAIIYGNSEIGFMGIVHCSWMTLSDDIIEKALKEFLFLSNVSVDLVKAFIFPGICQKCYEVDRLVFNKFSILDRIHFESNNFGLFQLDLGACIKARLERLKIKMANIKKHFSCSAHSISELDEKNFIFYSHRARKEAERNIVFVKMPRDNRLIASSTGDCPYVILYT